MIETKSQLAQLLAQEGINVIHDPSMSTAAFDPIKRELYLPVLKEMTGDVYDLFVLHEVGHALYTPKDGFHSTPEEKGMRYKGFLNIVEDARIEKKIKRKYPGGRSNMIRGYHNLMEQDFFGVKNLNPSSLGMIDRFNLYFKCGLALNIKFTDEEMEFIERGQKLESWDDVLDLVEDLWEYADGEEPSTDLQEYFQTTRPDDDYEDGEELDIDLPSGPSDQDIELGDSSRESEGESKQGEGEDGEEEENDEFSDGPEGGSFVAENQDWNPTQNSITDSAFRRREKELVKDDIDYNYHYVNVPDCDPSMFVADTKRVIEDCVIPGEKTVEYRKSMNYRNHWWTGVGPESIEEWMKINKPIISYMVKEFEMRKSAQMSKRAKISQTGILNTSSLYKYKIDDKIFKSILHVPEGKNHGLIFYIDFSGSMNNIIGDVVQQAMLMAMFCRQVKIPYRIYGFTNGKSHKLAKILEGMTEHDTNPYQLRRARRRELIPREHKDMDIDFSLCLYELFSDKQTSAEFKRISKAIIEFPVHGAQIIGLGGTPLNDAIMNGMNLANEFRRQYGLDIVNTIFMSDGDSNGNNRYADFSGEEREDAFFSIGRDCVNIKHKKSGAEVMVPRLTGHRRIGGGWILTEKLMELYKKATGSNVIFMNIVNRIEPYAANKADVSWFQLKELVRKDGFHKSKTEGVDGFYTILSRAFRIKDDAEKKFDGMQAGEQKLSSVRSAFRSMSKNRIKQRFLVGNFIEEIA